MGRAQPASRSHVRFRAQSRENRARANRQLFQRYPLPPNLSRKIITDRRKEKPTPKSVEVYFTKKRSDLRKLVVKSGICHAEGPDGSLKRRANEMTEAEEAAQDVAFSRTPMVWSPEADAQLMLFGLGRRLTATEEGRMARQIPGKWSGSVLLLSGVLMIVFS